MGTRVRIIKTVVVFLVCAVIVPAIGFAAPKKPDTIPTGDYTFTKEYLSWLIPREMSKNKVTGLSIALVDDQRIVWTQGFGYADKKNDIPARPETVYRIASISKLFTASALMRLSEQGKVNIDEPLQRYLPDFTIKTRFPKSDPITLRNIMTHHSGLPSNFFRGMFSRIPDHFSKVIPELKDEYVSFPANYVFSYSNLGPTLLGTVIERVTGKEYGSYMDEAIIRPLGMTSSTFSWRANSALSKAYRKGKEIDDPRIRDIPAGGLLSNVLDLSRFISMVLAGGYYGDRQILKAETIAEMLRPQNTKVPLDLGRRVGLAWMLGNTPNVDIQNGGLIAHHSGSLFSFNSQLIVLPETRLGVVVLCNSSTGRQTVDKIAAEAVKLALETKKGITQPQPLQPAETGRPLSPTETRAYEGNYATPMGLVTITGKKHYFLAEAADKTFRLVPRTDATFALKYKLFGFIPVRLGNLEQMSISRNTVAGHELLVARSWGQDTLLGQKIVYAPVSERWRARAGIYEIVNGTHDVFVLDRIRMTFQNGLLVIEYSAPLVAESEVSFAISPISDSEALIPGLGYGTGDTIRAITIDGKDGLQYSGYRFKKVLGPEGLVRPGF